VLLSCETLERYRHDMDADTSQGICQVVRKIWCQRGLTVWQVKPKSPRRSRRYAVPAAASFPGAASRRHFISNCSPPKPGRQVELVGPVANQCR